MIFLLIFHFFIFIFTKTSDMRCALFPSIFAIKSQNCFSLNVKFYYQRFMITEFSANI